MPQLDDLAFLAGFIAAHALWCVEDGEALCPMLASIDAKGRREIQRFEADRMEEACAAAHAALDHGVPGAVMGVAVTDGYISLVGGKTDSLLVIGRHFKHPEITFKLAIPYRNAKDPAGFAVHRPKFLEVPDALSAPERIGKAFFEGVSAHEKGSALWDASLDESR